MDNEILVSDRIRVGESLLKRLVDQQIDVSAACWAKLNEDGLLEENRWRLLIASKYVDEHGLVAAYRELRKIIDESQLCKASLNNVQFLSPSDSIARGISASQRRLAAHFPSSPIRSYGPELGRLSVDEAYFYPIQFAEAA